MCEQKPFESAPSVSPQHFYTIEFADPGNERYVQVLWKIMPYGREAVENLEVGDTR